MIEGFKIDVKGSELQALLRKRIERKQRRIGELETAIGQIVANENRAHAPSPFQAPSPVEARVAEMIGYPIDIEAHLPPIGRQMGGLRGVKQASVGEMAKRWVEGEKRAVEALTFIADHVVVAETYRIDAPLPMEGHAGYMAAHALQPVMGMFDFDEIA